MVVRGASAAGQGCAEQRAEESRPATPALGTMDNPCVIVKYRNGLLVGGRFYSYEAPRCRELLGMLNNKEFDKDLLGLAGDDAYVLIEDRDEIFDCYVESDASPDTAEEGSNKKFKVESSAPAYASDSNADAAVLPETVSIHPDAETSVVFKLLYNNRVTLCRVDGSLTVDAVLSYLFNLSGERLWLVKGDAVLDRSASVKSLDRCLVRARVMPE
ncbi:hypothetical protein PAPHI01_2055 [Pancytospora philotis]|nr:hypothetical protein PAPHI01_2055 [Pancytospora philotis]